MKIKFIFVILICLFLLSCIEIKQKINIEKNGSGNTEIEIAFESKWLSSNAQAISELKSELQKDGWSVREGRRGEKYFIFAARGFKDISELNEEVVTYELISIKKGSKKKSFSLYIRYGKYFDLLDYYTFSSYQIYIKMPGKIEETNGEKISSNEAKWDFNSFPPVGTALFVKSSVSAMPDFVTGVIVILALLLLSASIVILSKILKPRPYLKKEIIYCTQCGKENPGNASFCTNCGQKIE
jgi:hypothetical protein